MSAYRSKHPSNRITIYLVLIVLLVAGLWLRLRFIHTVQLYPDEFVTLLAVRMIGEKGLPVMPSGLFYDHGLLFSYLGSLATFFGPARLTVRYASLLFGLLCLGLTFFAGHRWFSPLVGLIATAGLVIAPTAIQWSGRARMYALLQLLVLVSLWLAYEGQIHRKAGWRWIALFAYLGATLTHFVAVSLAPPLVLAAIALRRLQTGAADQGDKEAAGQSPLLRPPAPPHRANERSLWVEGMALAGILIVSFLVKRAGQPKGIEALEVGNALPGLAQVFAIYSDFSVNLVGGWQAIAPFFLSLPALIFTPFVLLMVGLSLATIARGSKGEGAKGRRVPRVPLSPRSPAIYLSLILTIAAAEMILFVSPDRRDDKYLFMLLPVLFLLGAQGMEVAGARLLAISHQWSVVSGQWLTSGHASRLAHQASRITHHLAPVLVSALILAASRPAVQALLADTGDDYESAFAYLQDHRQAGDTVLTGTPAAAAFYLGHNDFYGVQRGGGYDYRILTLKGQPVDRWLGSPAIRTEAALHQTLAGNRVWLVLERWGLQREYYDLSFQQQLLAQTDYVGQTQGIFILRSKPDPHPLQLNPAHPTEAVFGNLVRLFGYTLEPEQAPAGHKLRLTLYWQALAPMSHDYTVFVHLRRSAGDIVAQADHRPLGNLYPTSIWPVGETIRESSDLPLPADLLAGNYDLWVGLYLLETGERLAVKNDASGENAVRLGKVTVLE